MRTTAELTQAAESFALNMTLLQATDTEIEEQRVHIDSVGKVPVKGLMKNHACIAVNGGVAVRDTSCFCACSKTSPTCDGWSVVPIDVGDNIIMSILTNNSNSDEVPITQVINRRSTSGLSQRPRKCVVNETSSDDGSKDNHPVIEVLSRRSCSRPGLRSRGKRQSQAVQTETSSEYNSDDSNAPLSKLSHTRRCLLETMCLSCMKVNSTQQRCSKWKKMLHIHYMKHFNEKWM